MQFDLNRTLAFTPHRSLSFVPNRDLGFGKKGKVFRGYVCSACESVVGALDKECSQCGAVFETRVPVKASKVPKPQAPTSDKIFCTYCGSQVESGHTYCGKCGMKLRASPRTDQESARGKSGDVGDSRGYAAIKLPKKKENKTVMDWSETGKEFEELVEK